MNQTFCNPSTKYIFRFSFYVGSFFFSLYFLMNKRETILCFWTMDLNKGGPSAPEQRFRIRYIIPKGVQLTKVFATHHPNIFSDFHFILEYIYKAYTLYLIQPVGKYINHTWFMHSLILRNEWGYKLSVTGPSAPMNQRFWVLYFSLGFVWRTTEKRFSTRVLQPIRQFYFQVFILFWFSIFMFVFFEEQERNGFYLFFKQGFL